MGVQKKSFIKKHKLWRRQSHGANFAIAKRRSERVVKNPYLKMPWGKFKGVRVVDIPAESLLWTWDNNDWMHYRGEEFTEEIVEFISDNLEVLRKEVGREGEDEESEEEIDWLEGLIEEE